MVNGEVGGITINDTKATLSRKFNDTFTGAEGTKITF